MFEYLTKLVLFALGFKPMHEDSRRFFEQLLRHNSQHILVCNQSNRWYEWVLLYVYLLSEGIDTRRVTFVNIHKGKNFLLEKWCSYPQAVVVTGGINFHPLIRTFHCGSMHVYYSTSFYDVWSYVLSALRVIYPLDESCVDLVVPKQIHFSNLSNYKVVYRNVPKVDCIDIVTLSSLLMMIPAIASMFAGLLDISVATAIASITSTMYHRSYEQNYDWKWYDSRTVLFLMGSFLSRLVRLHSWDVLVSYVMALVSLVHLYIGSMNRTQSLYRTRQYTWYHAAYHCYLSLILLWYSYNVELHYI